MPLPQSGVHVPRPDRLPGIPPRATWEATLREYLLSVAALAAEADTPDKKQWDFIDPAIPYPFEEILAPFVAVAWQQYVERAGPAYARLTIQAHTTLQRHLLQVLTSFSVQVLHSEFTRVCTQEHHFAGEQPVDESVLYLCFIKHLYHGGLTACFRSYPVLARLLATTCDLWADANVDFLRRLENDWGDLQQTFGADRVAGPVTMIQPALSEPHNGRRTVMALTFASGYQLVYKPTNIGLEESFNRLLLWCNESGITPSFKVLTSINRDQYGWVEFVEYKPCQDQQELQRYYQRVGMLLCLVYLLGGVNCTHEHIIACGEHPVLVDTGMLMHAYACPDHQNTQVRERCSDWEEQDYSVLHTGFLTNWQSFPTAAQVSDVSTLGTGSKHALLEQKNKQVSSQEHHIALKYGCLKPREHLNVPLLPTGESANWEEHRKDISAGFHRCYLLLLAEQSALSSPDGPFQQFKRQSVRFIYRQAQAYNALLPKLLAPESLCSDINHRAVLVNLNRDVLPVEYHLWEKKSNSVWRAVCASEQQALLQGDIPFFSTYPDSTALTAIDGQEIAHCFHQLAFNLMQARLKALSYSDMQKQSGYIAGALHAVSCLRSDDRTQVKAHAASAELTEHELVIEALRIADELARQAIDLQDGSVTWLTTMFLQRSQRYQLQPMKYSLFDGTSGVALFLAAAARISNRASYRDLALAAVQPICQRIHSHGDMLLREIGIGGAVGLGSIVYAFTRISQFINEPQLLVDARMAAGLMKAEHIVNDQVLDIIAGAAGTIPGLLALYDASGDQEILELACLCAQHLMKARTMSSAGCLAWPTLGGKHCTGFAHGIAGIAYALTRLYAITHDADLLSAAREALIYEDCAFIAEVGNWPDVLGASKSMVMTAWCHGAPGIGLARLGGLPVLDTTRIRADIEVALRTTQSFPQGLLDFLCCGNLGRAEFLFTAGHLLTRPELIQDALGNTRSLIARARLRGSFHLNGALPGLSIPKFFHGTAGIGYTFLRMAYPHMFPSVLLWQ
ncbi:type 2 lanthipeptide synthetase LanM family protein [Dictyobacter aurantiacus]|uniref:Lanthionine synthetase n=1 Tax=Dictyobacter aurantiacus TaxID=1936993 RepID=A0A401ZGH6_9CHLR|nr:type 2 lanthipeptide synthetase LanM family protein [Dictyobacter aurantiacus]GCE05967.1 lanthionine synthetase [Dictyobacter aurantiacus]